MGTTDILQPGRTRATMRDVADRAGVSLMTVSRVLNNSAAVKLETRERVEDAVKALGYRPNIGARRLAGGRSMFVGLLYHNPSPGYISKVIKGGLDACRQRGHHLVLEDFGHVTPFESPEESVAALNLSSLDGIIVTPPLSVHAPFMAALRERGLPVVAIAPDNIEADGLFVAIDDARAVEDMVDHLAAHGHSRIGFVRGPESHGASAHRWQGFQRGMAARGLSVNADWVVDGNFTYRSGIVAGRALLQAEPRPSAIVASNDDMAAGVISAAHQLQVSVPGEVSVVGFDDIELASAVWPELTTVRQPIADMARHAVDLLDGLISGAKPSPRILDYSLVSRDSVAAPKS